jgi:hypothetical protein
VGSNCIFYDGKAETCATEFARATFVNAVETFEEVVEVLRFYARAIVANQELIEMAAFGFCLFADNVETRGSCSVGNGIVDEIAEDAVEQTCISEYFYMSGHLKQRGDAFVVELQGGVVESTLDDVQDIHMVVIIT